MACRSWSVPAITWIEGPQARGCAIIQRAGVRLKGGSPHETEKLYAKSPPNSRSWLTTALSPALSCFCPVEAYRNSTEVTPS